MTIPGEGGIDPDSITVLEKPSIETGEHFRRAIYAVVDATAIGGNDGDEPVPYAGVFTKDGVIGDDVTKGPVFGLDNLRNAVKIVGAVGKETVYDHEISTEGRVFFKGFRTWRAQREAGQAVVNRLAEVGLAI